MTRVRRHYKRDTEIWLERWDRARWQRRWRTPLFPLPDYIDTIGWVMRTTGVNGVEAPKLLALGLLNFNQAERLAAYYEKHPTEIWGRLWTDVALLEDQIERDAIRLKRFALTWKAAAA